ncbi:PucR family transcriptional regulator [Clostridium thermarum]|uniref:PucR family transcriptional regulator n=1 Tax=Clostridium thermarum TaxID=1716543 RepID=UPI0013D05B80|nr:helix-turn-helix domain-containing protein [Clostridium thermarum]
MYNFESYLRELAERSGVNFKLIGEDDTIYYDSGIAIPEERELRAEMYLGKSKTYIIMDKKSEICKPLLEYSIQTKYGELFSTREQLIINVLEGKEIGTGRLDKDVAFLAKGCTLFLVSVDGSKYEALSIIKQLYNVQDVLSMVYGDYIIVLGNFDEVTEHAESIRDSIVSDLYCSSRVSFAYKVYSIDDIKKAYNDAKECMELGRKFDVKGDIYDYNHMLFEKVVYNIDPRLKNELLESFKDKFSLFDNEMINTIEEFINSGLNISDASRKLYIHRNTLIYRLDKIHKDTGYDIRDFKQATVFIIAFLVWKEKR